MGLVKFTDHIYYLPYEEETDRPNLYYILGKNYSVAVDAGNSSRHVEKFYEELKKNNLPLPKVTYITHWHWDHTFGLPYINGTSVSSVETYFKLKKVAKWKWDIESMKRREIEKEDIYFCNVNIIKEYPSLDEIKVVLPDEFLDEDEEVDLGDIHLKIIVSPSVHSSDSLFVYVEEEKTLIIGDADCKDYYSSVPVNKDRLESMKKLFSSLEPDNYLYGHDEPGTKEDEKKLLNEMEEEL